MEVELTYQTSAAECHLQPGRPKTVPFQRRLPLPEKRIRLQLRDSVLQYPDNIGFLPFFPILMLQK
jgi:hypothetical protein